MGRVGIRLSLLAALILALSLAGSMTLPAAAQESDEAVVTVGTPESEQQISPVGDETPISEEQDPTGGEAEPAASQTDVAPTGEPTTGDATQDSVETETEVPTPTAEEAAGTTTDGQAAGGEPGETATVTPDSKITEPPLDEPGATPSGDPAPGDATPTDAATSEPPPVTAEPGSPPAGAGTPDDAKASEVEPQGVPGVPSELTVIAVTSNGLPLAGACFTVNSVSNGAPGDVVLGPGCSDVSGYALVHASLASGQYFLVQTAAPTDFQAISPRLLSFRGGETLNLEIENAYIGDATTGTVDIEVLYDVDSPLGDACFRVFAAGDAPAGTPVEEGCTDANGDLSFDLDPGDYVLVEYRLPDGFEPTHDRAFSVFAGETVFFQIINNPNGHLSIYAVTSNGNPLGGVCFTLNASNAGSPGAVLFGPACSSEPGFALGIFMPPGQYFVVETQTPVDYLRPEPQSVTVVPEQETLVEVVHTYVGDSTMGTLHVLVVEHNGLALADACFQVFAAGEFPDGAPIEDGCSDANGDLYLTLEFGDYVLFEHDPPDDFSALDETTEFAIFPGETTRLAVSNTLTHAGTFVVTKVDENGDPLGGACFTFYEDLAPAPGEIEFDQERPVAGGCSDVAGLVFSPLVKPGIYVAVESLRPEGYQRASDVEFAVIEDQTTRIEIVNVREIPPGRLLIVSRFCDGGEDAVIFAVDGPGDAQALAVDDLENCEPGAGEFLLTLSGRASPSRLGVDSSGEGLFEDIESTGPGEHHLLTDVATGAEVEFQIGPFAVTTITVTHVSAVDPDDEGDDEEDSDPDDVVSLPDTGAGRLDSAGDDQASLALTSLMILAVAYIWRCRRRLGKG